MEIKVVFSQIQFDATVDFIAENNPTFLGRHQFIRESITTHINELALRYPDVYTIGTMGYQLWADMIQEEDMDDDENILRIEFLVDPALGMEDACEEQNLTAVHLTKKLI